METQYEYLPGDETHYGAGASTNLVKKITQNGMNFEYAYDNRGNIISEKRGELTTTYAYDALGQLIRVNDPYENATWVYNYDRGGNILSKVKYAYTEGELGTAVETIPYVYGDSNWKDKLTAYNGKTITYDAIGNPLNDGERQYEWEAGRRLKKMIVKGDPAEGIENGFDEGSATSLKLEFSNGNLLMGEISNTVISAKVYRKDVDVTDEYTATAFNWTRTSSDESADASWNAAHSGMKSIPVSVSELSDDIQIQCTLTGISPAYGSVDVNDSFIASHTRGEADSNDTLSIEDGALFVTTDDDNYRLSGNELTALYPRLNGSVSANAWIYHTQPLKTIEFKYNSAGLRVQKKVIANGKSEVTDYTLHGKLVMHMTVGNDKLHFFYDAQSRPAKVNFNGTTYTYLHNLQGDIVGIIDKSGVLVVEYKYDAWGRSISITGLLAATLGKRNPFRYRRYIYDEETKLFYLRSRYYNPMVERFVNADSYIGKISTLGQHNLFSYCANVPVGLIDENGRDFWSELGYLGELLAYNYMHESELNFWNLVCDGLDAAGYVHSARLLRHSLQPRPDDLLFRNCSSLAMKIKRDSEFKKKMAEIIEKQNFGTETSVIFNSDFDLFGSLHKVAMIVSPITVNGEEIYHVTMTDKYDFTFEGDYSSQAPSFWQRAMKAGAIGGNNLAWLDSKLGVINEYNIVIDFYY